MTPVLPAVHAAEQATNGSNIMVWARAITMMAVPSVITLIVVWVGTQEMPKLVRTTDMIYQAIIANREIMREAAARDEEILRLMRWICAGVQRNDADRRSCFEK